MRDHPALNILIDAAEREHRCFQSAGSAIGMAIHRRVEAGDIRKLWHNQYAVATYWNDLSRADRLLHVARGLATVHPTWVFAELVAADAYGLEHSWSLYDGSISIATSVSSADMTSSHRRSRLRRVYVNNVDCCEINDLRVTSPERTVVDCALRYSFCEAMPILNSALRLSLVTKEGVEAACRTLRRDLEPVLLLVRYADGTCENGGESLCYATIIWDGFMVPEVQRRIVDPANPNMEYRVDFLWHTADGRVIVAEYDGAQKYVDPQMTNGRSVHQVVRLEREREDALRRWGVDEIVRLTYDEVKARTPMDMKLIKAGVPRVERPWNGDAALL